MRSEENKKYLKDRYWKLVIYMKNNKGFFYLLVLFLIISFTFVGNSISNINNRKLKKAILAIDSSPISLNEIVPFEWDAVYQFGPYLSKQQMETAMGFKSDSIHEIYTEGIFQIVFVKDEKIVCNIRVLMVK